MADRTNDGFTTGKYRYEGSVTELSGEYKQWHLNLASTITRPAYVPPTLLALTLRELTRSRVRLTKIHLHG